MQRTMVRRERGTLPTVRVESEGERNSRAGAVEQEEEEYDE